MKVFLSLLREVNVNMLITIIHNVLDKNRTSLHESSRKYTITSYEKKTNELNKKENIGLKYT